MFQNRTEAGILLAKKLGKYKSDNGVVLAVPRGGVPIGYEVAQALKLPLQVILTKKIGHPMNKEFAIGAASLTDYFIEPQHDVGQEYIDRELTKTRNRLREMDTLFEGSKEKQSFKGKTLFVIDDGIATGNTLLGTINILKKQNPEKIIIGVPVASQSSVLKLSGEVHDVVTLLIPESFYGVGAFYEDFGEVSDEAVKDYLRKAMLNFQHA